MKNFMSKKLFSLVLVLAMVLSMAVIMPMGASAAADITIQGGPASGAAARTAGAALVAAVKNVANSKIYVTPGYYDIPHQGESNGFLNIDRTLSIVGIDGAGNEITDPTVADAILYSSNSADGASLNQTLIYVGATGVKLQGIIIANKEERTDKGVYVADGSSDFTVDACKFTPSSTKGANPSAKDPDCGSLLTFDGISTGHNVTNCIFDRSRMYFYTAAPNVTVKGCTFDSGPKKATWAGPSVAIEINKTITDMTAGSLILNDNKFIDVVAIDITSVAAGFDKIDLNKNYWEKNGEVIDPNTEGLVVTNPSYTGNNIVNTFYTDENMQLADLLPATPDAIVFTNAIATTGVEEIDLYTVSGFPKNKGIREFKIEEDTTRPNSGFLTPVFKLEAYNGLGKVVPIYTPVTIGLTLKDPLTAQKIIIKHFRTNKTVETITPTIAGKVLTFTADSLSLFGITSAPRAEIELTETVAGTPGKYDINVKAIGANITNFQLAEFSLAFQTLPYLTDKAVDYKITPNTVNSKDMVVEPMERGDENIPNRFIIRRFEGTVPDFGPDIPADTFIKIGTLEITEGSAGGEVAIIGLKVETGFPDRIVDEMSSNAFITYGGEDYFWTIPGDGDLKVLDETPGNPDIIDLTNSPDHFLPYAPIDAPVGYDKQLTVKITFGNKVDNNPIDYQKMKVTISSDNRYGPKKVYTYDLGNDNADVTFNMDQYTIVKNNLPAGKYSVKVSGDGYRTCTIGNIVLDSTLGNDKKTVEFWNNARDLAKGFVTRDLDDTEDSDATMSPVSKISGSTTYSQTTFLAGDIVMDNEIKIEDLNAALSYFGLTNLKISLLHPEDLPAGTLPTDTYKYIQYDLNRDGKIDSKDVAMVLISYGF